MKRILLVTDPGETATLTAILKGARSDAEIDAVSNLEALDAATQGGPADLRVLTFATDVIVPERVLNRLAGPAYNIHPGPPDLPGLYPAVYALYEGDTTFGVTVHEIAPQIDTGAIVAVSRIAIPTGCDRLGLETIARSLMLDLDLAPHLIESEDALPRIGEIWSGPRRTRADFEALCRVPYDVDDAEFHRRYRAVGEGPDHALKMERFGRTFSIDAVPTDAPVVRGGRPVDPSDG